jgi:hypothetical protein
MPTLRVFKMTSTFVVLTQQWRNALEAGTRELLRTLGRLRLRTLELHDMPLGTIAKELVEGDDGWGVGHLERLERLALNNCNMDSPSTLVLLRSCANLRELELQCNFGNIDSLGDAAFGVGSSGDWWSRRLKPAAAPAQAGVARCAGDERDACWCCAHAWREEARRALPVCKPVSSAQVASRCAGHY